MIIYISFAVIIGFIGFILWIDYKLDPLDLKEQELLEEKIRVIERNLASMEEDSK